MSSEQAALRTEADYWRGRAALAEADADRLARVLAGWHACPDESGVLADHDAAVMERRKEGR